MSEWYRLFENATLAERHIPINFWKSRTVTCSTVTMLNLERGSKKKTIYLISDFQQYNWEKRLSQKIVEKFNQFSNNWLNNNWKNWRRNYTYYVAVDRFSDMITSKKIKTMVN